MSEIQYINLFLVIVGLILLLYRQTNWRARRYFIPALIVLSHIFVYMISLFLHFYYGVFSPTTVNYWSSLVRCQELMILVGILYLLRKNEQK